MNDAAVIRPEARAAFARWPLPEGLDTPAVVVDLPTMEGNIRRMATALAERGVGFRPHTKTHKCVEIARRQLDAGADGITTATIGEAEVFAAAGIRDIFIAYPVWPSSPKARRLAALAERCRLRVGIDSAAAAAPLGDVARGLEVLIEVDSGEGRTGVPDAGAAADVAGAARAHGLNVVGVFTHGGHSYRSPGATGEAADDEVRSLLTAAEALRADGHDVQVLSSGSTPTAIASARDGVTEERPGTFVFGDRQQTALGAVRPEDVAMAVAATVVSVSASPRRFVVDAGAKVLSKDGPPTVAGFGAVPTYPDAVVTRTFDHHGIVEIGAGERPSAGEVVTVVPNHACPVVNLADELVIVEDGKIVDRWPVDARCRNR
ncbi:alanine racemase [Actinoallomurus acaciae]|uniref:Alanine racemase n=1 Tax=Actinoallomurus acaciae TaxID=502577 RepID=A0ABV5Y9J5_9ACTN